LFHLVDRFVGIPVLFAMSIVRRRRALPQPEDVREIALMMFGAIGDSLLAAALIPDLKRAYPQARLKGYLTGTSRPIADVIDGFDEVVHLPLKNPRHAVAVMRRCTADLVIDFGQWARVNALLSACAPKAATVGLRTEGHLRHLCYDALADHSGLQHEIENFRGLARAIGLNPVGQPPLRSPGQGVALEGRWVAFHPWASGIRSEMREWPEERWLILAARLREIGVRVVVTGGPTDRVRSEALVAAIGNDALSVAGRISLRDTMGVLESACAVVSVNTGIMHLAAAQRRPLVALHGPTNPVRWRPVSDNSVVLGGDPADGCGFLNFGYEYPSNPPDCMGMISVDAVWDALSRMIGDVAPANEVRRRQKVGVE
jgi:ADP-heptose:LPS heptosyltransferase